MYKQDGFGAPDQGRGEDGYFKGYEGGYTNRSGSANDVGKRRLTDESKEPGKRTKISNNMDLSMVEEMIKFNQQAFEKLAENDSKSEVEKQEGMKKCIERQQMLMEMKVEMMKSIIGMDDNVDEPMEGCSVSFPQGGINRGEIAGPPHPFRGRGRSRGSDGFHVPWGRGGGPRMRGNHRPVGFGPPTHYGRGRGFPLYPSMDMIKHEEPINPNRQTSIEDKLYYFKEYLLNHVGQLGESPIEILMNCKRSIQDPAYQMYLDYKYENIDDKLVARLKINSIYFAKSTGTDERVLRESVHAKALYIFYTKPVTEMFYNSNVENDEIAKKTNTRAIKHYFVPTYCIHKLNALNRKLPKTHSDKDVIRDFDYVCEMNGITVTLLLYKVDGRAGEQIMCDLYADDCYLGTGMGAERKEAIKKAYINSKAVVERGSFEKVVNENKRLSSIDKTDPQILDIVCRGRFYEVGSNMSNLINSGVLRKYETNPQNELVVLIQCKEKEPVPYKVLETTATVNGIKLEYVLHCCEKSKESKEFRCFIFLNQRQIATEVGQNKPQAKFNASEAALKELTSRYTLIEYPTRFYRPTTTNDSLIAMGTDLKTSGIDLSQILPPTFSMETIFDELDPYVYLILENMIQDYASKDTLEELIFGPDLSDAIVNQLIIKCQESGVDGNRRKLPSGLTFFVVQKIKCYTTLQMSDLLITQPGFKSGRYTLIHLRQPKGKIQLLNRCSKDTSRYLKPQDDEGASEELSSDMRIFEPL